MTLPRRVLDTNVLVSRLLMVNSLPGRVARHAAETGILLVSDATLDELVNFVDPLLPPGSDLAPLFHPK